MKFWRLKEQAWKHTLNPMINSQISYVKKEIVKMSGTRFENKLNSAYDWIQINIKFGILTFKLRSALSLLEKHIQYQLYIKTKPYDEIRFMATYLKTDENSFWEQRS